MDKTELIEFIKLFKREAEAEEKEEEEEEEEQGNINEINETNENNTNFTQKKKKKKSWFDIFEDRMFTFLILLIFLIYFYLLGTGQSFILKMEIEKFQESHKIIKFKVLKFLNENYEIEEVEYKAEKLKYEKYASREELQVDWKVLSKNEIKCSNDLMKETLKLINEQIKMIKAEVKTFGGSVGSAAGSDGSGSTDTIKTPASNNATANSAASNTATANTATVNIATANIAYANNALSGFEEFKKVFNPIDPFSFNSKSSDNIKQKFDEIFVTQIREYFKIKLIKIISNLFKNRKVIFFSLKQQILFLKKLLLSISKLENVPKDFETSLKNLKIRIQTILTTKENSIQEFENNLKKCFDELKTKIELIPIYPKKEENDKIETEIENEMAKTNNLFIKFFENFYSK